MPLVFNNQAVQKLPIPTNAPQEPITTQCRERLEDNGHGTWVWHSGNQTTAVTQDPRQGITIAPEADPTGRSGCWKRIVAPDRELWVDWFGTHKDMKTDDAQAIQAANDLILYGTDRIFSTLRFGPYRYGSSTLYMGYGRPGPKQITWKGMGRRYRGGGTYKSGTAIYHVGKELNVPLINSQAGRGHRIEGLTLIGKLYDGIQSLWENRAEVGTALLEEKTWHDLGGHDRYAPYAGIAIDGLSGPSRGTAYPLENEPTWVRNLIDGEPTHNQGYSSAPEIIDVEISGFSVGIVTHPNGSNGNGDFLALTDCSIELCVYGLSISHTQARNNKVHELQLAKCFVGLTTKTHGMGQGHLGGLMSDVSGGQIIDIFKCGHSNHLGGPSFVNWYMEDVYRLGEFGDAGSAGTGVETQITFLGCKFVFTMQGTGEKEMGVPAMMLDGGAFSLVVFRDCTMVNHISSFSHRTAVDFDNCSIHPRDKIGKTIKRYEAFAHSCTGGVMSDTRGIYPQPKLRYATVNLETGKVNASGGVDQGGRWGFGNGRGSRSAPYSIYARWVSPGADYYGFESPAVRQYQELRASQIKSIKITQLVLEIELPALTDERAIYRGFEPGDIIYHPETGTQWYIRKRIGAKITAEQQNNYQRDGKTALVPINLSTAFFQFVNTRHYVLSYDHYGKFTKGSPIVSEVKRTDGAMTFDAQVGDALYWDRRFHPARYQDEAGSLIKEIGPNLFQLSANANSSSKEPCLIRYFIRKPPENEETR